MKRVFTLLCISLLIILPKQLFAEESNSVVTYEATQGGSIGAILSDGMFFTSGSEVSIGSYVTFTATEKDGYYFKCWNVNGKELFYYQNELKYKVLSQKNHVVAVFDEIPKEGFKVTYVAEEGGKFISGKYMNKDYEWIPFKSGELIPAKSSLEFKVEPNIGNGVDKWYINEKGMGDNQNSIYSYTNTPINVRVTFKKIPFHKIEYSAEHGSVKIVYQKEYNDVEVKNGTTVAEGTSITITGFPDDGYKIDKWIINGQELMPNRDNPYSYTTKVEEPLVIKAIFKPLPKKYTITLSAGIGGSLDAKYIDADGWTNIFDGSKEIDEGTSVTAYTMPAPGYVVDKWYYNSTVVTPSKNNHNEYVFEVKENATISVSFKKSSSAGFPVTYSSGEGGQITEALAYLGSGPVPFKSGERVSDNMYVTFKAVPDTDYEIDNWVVNGRHIVENDGLSNYSMNIHEATDVQVTFKHSSYTVHLISPEGGTVLAKYKKKGEDKYTILFDGNSVPAGTDVTFWVNTDDGYEITNWYINSELQEKYQGKKEITYTVNSEVEVRVECKNININKYLINYSSNNGGSVFCETPDGERIETGSTVDESTKLIFTAKSSEGYVFRKWIVNEKEFSDSKEKLEIEVKSNIDIQALFDKEIKKYTLTYSYDNDHGTLQVIDKETNENIMSGSLIKEGSVVKLIAEVKNSNWTISNWFINGEKQTYSDNNIPTSIEVLINKDTDIKVEFIDVTSIPHVSNDRIRIYIVDNQFHIDGLSSPIEVVLYSINGEMLYSGRVKDSIDTINLKDNKYIVVINGKPYKVLNSY